MTMFGYPKSDFFSSKTRLDIEEYCQWVKITPERGEKGPFFREIALTVQRSIAATHSFCKMSWHKLYFYYKALDLS